MAGTLLEIRDQEAQVKLLLFVINRLLEGEQNLLQKLAFLHLDKKNCGKEITFFIQIEKLRPETMNKKKLRPKILKRKNLRPKTGNITFKLVFHFQNCICGMRTLMMSL